MKWEHKQLCSKENLCLIHVSFIVESFVQK